MDAARRPRERREAARSNPESPPRPSASWRASQARQSPSDSRPRRAAVRMRMPQRPDARLPARGAGARKRSRAPCDRREPSDRRSATRPRSAAPCGRGTAERPRPAAPCGRGTAERPRPAAPSAPRRALSGRGRFARHVTRAQGRHPPAAGARAASRHLRLRGLAFPCATICCLVPPTSWARSRSSGRAIRYSAASTLLGRPSRA